MKYFLKKLKIALQKEYDIDSYLKKSYKAFIENSRLARVKLNVVLHKEFDLDNYVKKSFGTVKENTKITCAKLNIILHKKVDIDYYVKKAVKEIIKSAKTACVKLNLILHKEVDLDYFVITSFKKTKEVIICAYEKLKTALQKQYDIDSCAKKALYSFAVFMLKRKKLFSSPFRYIIRAAAVVSIRARKVIIAISKFATLERIIIRKRIKQRRNNKVKARFEQERENIAFLTEFLNSLKEEFGADISFSLVSVNSDEGSFDVINEQ